MKRDTELRRFRRQGVDEDTLALAVATQDGQRRTRGKCQSLDDILAGRPWPTPRTKGADVVPLSDRQHRRRGLLGQNALNLHEAAMLEPDPEKAAVLHRMAQELRVLSSPVQLEFNFLKGNWSVSDDYLDAVMTRLRGKPHENEACKVLLGLMRFVGKLDPESKFGTQDELAAYVGMQRPHVTRAMKLLEEIGAIKRVRKGRASKVFITPEGVYRGSMDKHAETVARYAKVVELHPKAQTGDMFAPETDDKQ